MSLTFYISRERKLLFSDTSGNKAEWLNLIKEDCFSQNEIISSCIVIANNNSSWFPKSKVESSIGAVSPQGLETPACHSALSLPLCFGVSRSTSPRRWQRHQAHSSQGCLVLLWVILWNALRCILSNRLCFFSWMQNLMSGITCWHFSQTELKLPLFL